MLLSQSNKAVLLLEDGSFFEGLSAGKKGTTSGELCFNTGMTGYQEIFTDPSYFGQILITTNVHIGNYGVKNTDTESDKVQIAGLICHQFTNQYSRKRAESNLQDYCEREGLIAISHLDTRQLVRHIRSKGAMNAIISSEILDKTLLKEMLDGVPSMEGLELASKVTTPKPYLSGSKESKYKIAAIDYGIKKNILQCMVERGCCVKVFPAKSGFEEMESWDPDAYFLSNGPGDPAAMNYAIATVKKILETGKPLFGICLGHQLLALALGATTFKMHHGHRGINHPVKNMETGHCEITSQNHGFCVSQDALNKLSDTVKTTHLNLNDHTVEGLEAIGLNAFSVQYHPESSPGPHDSRYLFNKFLKRIVLYKDDKKPVKQYE